MTPAITIVKSWLWIPSTMKRPSPPPETIAPIVAVAMTWRVAVRKPPTMTGDATRQLELGEDLALAKAHPAAGLEQVAVDRRSPA